MSCYNPRNQMKRKRHTEEQIIKILKEAEAGLGTAYIVSKHGISEQPFYRWKSKYGKRQRIGLLP